MITTSRIGLCRHRSRRPEVEDGDAHRVRGCCGGAEHSQGPDELGQSESGPLESRTRIHRSSWLPPLLHEQRRCTVSSAVPTGADRPHDYAVIPRRPRGTGNRGRSVIVPSAADGVPDSSQQLQDHPDHYQDDPESPQNRNREQVCCDQQDNTKNDHNASSSSAWPYPGPL